MTTTPVMLIPPAAATPEGLLIRPHRTEWGLQQTMQPADAAAFLLTEAARSPRDWVDLVNLSSSLFLVGRYYSALDAAQAAVRDHRATPALLNLAIVLETLGRFEESHAAAREAHMLDTHDVLAGGLYADSLIRRGEWREGWPLHARYHHGLEPLRRFIAEWPGPAAAPPAGRRILVVEGGGFGDNILFLRWLPRLAALGAIVTYVAPAGLVSLVTASADALGIRAIIPNLRGNAAIRPADYDYFVPLLSLARHFDITLDDLTWTGPYLAAAPARAAARDMYGESATPTVGICWKAGEGAYPVRYRTLAESQLRRLLAVSVRWVSLQYDARPPVGCPVDEPAIHDWSDTAAILANLDLLVTVDTGVAHLAGAMGVPAWVMLPGRSSWPFLLGRGDSPLYPSLRMFRNRGVGIDNAVTAAVAALRDWTPFPPGRPS